MLERASGTLNYSVQYVAEPTHLQVLCIVLFPRAYSNTFIDFCVRGIWFDAVLCLAGQRKGMDIIMKFFRKLGVIVKDNIYMLSFVHKASPGMIIFSILISLTAFVDTVSNTWFSKIVFDSMQNGNSYLYILLAILLLLGLMMISSGIRSLFNNKYLTKKKEIVSGFTRATLYDKTRNLDYCFFENPDFYDDYTRALSEADNRALGVLSTLSSLSYSIISLFTLVGIIIWLDPVLLVFAAFGAIMSALVSKKLASIRYSYNFDKTNYDRKISYIHRVFYEPQYAKEIKIDNLWSYFISYYKSIVKDTVAFVKNRSNKIAFWEFVASIQNVIIQSAMIAFLTYRVYSHVISIGDYAALLNSTFSLMFQLQTITTIITQFIEHSLYINNFKRVMEKTPLIETDEGIKNYEWDNITVEFKNVSFRYPETEYDVLQNVNLIFGNHTTTALVGHNGAGKTTIIKLLLRLYDVTEGSILINGRNIKDYNVFSLRRMIATVFQDFETFAIPVGDYILSREHSQCDNKEISEYLSKVGLDQRSKSFAEGFNTFLTREYSKDGLVLSGGESQKLAIAKSLAKKTSCIILDEPSSALDPISEHDLQLTLMDCAKGKTVILISHRLSMTKNADVIYYMENGKCLESGSHADLMKLNGKYARMFHIQSQSYFEESVE